MICTCRWDLFGQVAFLWAAGASPGRLGWADKHTVRLWAPEDSHWSGFYSEGTQYREIFLTVGYLWLDTLLLKYWHWLVIISEVRKEKKERDSSDGEKTEEVMQSLVESLKMYRDLNVTRIEWAMPHELNVTWAAKVELNDMSAGWGAFSWAGCSWGEAFWARRPSQPTFTGTPRTPSSTRFFYQHLSDSFWTWNSLNHPLLTPLIIIINVRSMMCVCRRRWCLGWMKTTTPGSTIRSRLTRFTNENGHDYFDSYGCDECLDRGQANVMS